LKVLEKENLVGKKRW